MIKLGLLLAGGALGTVARYLVSGWAHRLTDSTFPSGTLIVNLAGSFLIGLMWGLTETQNFSTNLRVFIYIGLFGGFTTFSSFAFETFNLFKDNEIKLAFYNILANNVLGIALVFGGILLGRLIIELLK